MYANTVNTEITKTERNKVPRGENMHQSIDSINEKVPQEVERERTLRMSNPSQMVATRLQPAECMWRCNDGDTPIQPTTKICSSG